MGLGFWGLGFGYGGFPILEVLFGGPLYGLCILGSILGYPSLWKLSDSRDV